MKKFLIENFFMKKNDAKKKYEKNQNFGPKISDLNSEVSSEFKNGVIGLVYHVKILPPKMVMFRKKSNLIDL